MMCLVFIITRVEWTIIVIIGIFVHDNNPMAKYQYHPSLTANRRKGTSRDKLMSNQPIALSIVEFLYACLEAYQPVSIKFCSMENILKFTETFWKGLGLV